jgi:hypothetical protein
MAKPIHPADYLPLFMTDHSAMVEIFRRLDEMRLRSLAKNGGTYMASMTYVDAACYVVDIFLWYMARCGYTLQKTPKSKREAMQDRELQEDMAAWRFKDDEARYARMRSFMDDFKADAEKGQE